MTLSHDVQIWKLATRKRNRGHGVRWRVEKNEFSKWFATYALADSYRSRLLRCTRKGEGFDTDSGMPESILREQRAVTWFELACRYVDLKWPRAAAKTRTSTADALATVTPVLVTSTRHMPEPEVLREVLYGWAFHKTRRDQGEPEGDVAEALTWIRESSLKVTALDEKDRRSELIRGALNALALRMDGKPAAATTVARKRAVFHGVLTYAVELDILPANPIDKVSWKAPKVAEEVDRRAVASPRQIQALLAAVKAERPELAAFFGCLYYAFMRPGEAVSLRLENCISLPEAGWGRLVLTDNSPRVGAQWTDTGKSHDERHLKHRAEKTKREVPIPPVLVRLLRDHLKRSDVETEDELLFRGARGGPLSESVYGPIWQRARKAALSPAQVRSPLAARPYDLRHGGVTLALNAGVPAPEVARRAGHSVEVLLRVYAGCIDGHDRIWNTRIDEILKGDGED
ncbi:hypothetical protein ETD86_37980 [Nonomuraea turkmeniaca]|uniref:Tyr recombinase domain-containing protein n=1 Tax=Nonomuraea turkmeniaca TaxID=103838 RepID=A0A5S4F3T2_9ACTN|nr:tyrosine-type recombinase/integrase [Nonomuraea turkmeniaca]TMR10807.1 hypothetical protein ETD86_37980 [Nonomuraea turkmeniaca]